MGQITEGKVVDDEHWSGIAYNNWIWNIPINDTDQKRF
jgi:hypothetical protein